MGPDAKHGTHVAGIIGAVRGNGIGIDGIAPAVKFMMIRTVPDGDERDKDVANAIRYAADNGAQIISMSFGKAYSPYKAAVDEAVKYADAKGVLMVHAAGNDGADLGKAQELSRRRTYLDGGHPQNWIEVGASSWKGGDRPRGARSRTTARTGRRVRAGRRHPLDGAGQRVRARQRHEHGRAGVSAGSRRCSWTTSRPHRRATSSRSIHAVGRPGTRIRRSRSRGATRIGRFGSLSVTGGIVNAYAALKMALEQTGVRP